jgi:hypothetical protein
MDKVEEINEEIKTVNIVYQSAKNKWQRLTETAISIKRSSIDQEIAKAESVKQQCLRVIEEEKTEYQRGAMEHSTSRQIQENLDNVLRVISGELQEEDIPGSLKKLKEAIRYLNKIEKYILEQQSSLENYMINLTRKLTEKLAIIKQERDKKLTVLHARLLIALKETVEELESQGIKYITVD